MCVCVCGGGVLVEKLSAMPYVEFIMHTAGRH